MEQGQFATNVELAETESNTRRSSHSLFGIFARLSETAIDRAF
jgi:hypothetical protein